MIHTQLLFTTVPNSPAPSECSSTECGKIIDDGHTTSYVLNFGVAEPNLTKFYTTYRMVQNKIAHQTIFNISATSGLISKILDAV